MKDDPLEYQILPTPLTPAQEQDLRKEMEDYARKAQHTLQLQKLTPKLRKKVRRLLNAGEDPFPVAVYYKLPFNDVADIANEILEAAGIKSRIPTNLPDYLKVSAVMAEQKRKESPKPETPHE